MSDESCGVYIHTVCIDHCEGYKLSRDRMWHCCFLDLNQARRAVVEDWADLEDKGDQPLFMLEKDSGPCLVFEDYANTGYCWTIMTTDLMRRPPK